MQRAIGIDLADDHTRWAVVDGRRPVAAGRVRSCATIDGHEVDHVVSHLGRAEPIMVGTVPYGAEALVGRLLASVVGDARAEHGELAVALVHDDDLDDYRRSLLVEAARVGDLGSVTLVLRSAALELAATRPPEDGDLAAAQGAAMSLADEDRRGALGPAAAIGGGGAIGIAAGAAVSSTGQSASATAATTGLAGPTGTPLMPTAGPTGTPLTPTAGPTGTPLTPTPGPTGTPLTPTPGPTGTPLTPAAGPTGTPLPAPAAAGKNSMPLPDGSPVAGAATGVGRRGLGALIGAGAVATVVVVGLVVLTTGNDDEPTVRPAAAAAATDADADEDVASATTVAAEEPAPTTVAAAEAAPATTVPAATAPATSVPEAAGIDLAPFVGSWLTPCDPYIDGSGGANRGVWTFALAGPGRLTFESGGLEHATPDCSDAGVDMGGDGHRGLFSAELEAIDTTTIDGLTAIVVRDTGDGTVGVMAIDASGTLRVGGLEGTSVPTSFYEVTGSRE